MSNLNLFSKSGQYTPPDAATLAALSEPERNAIGHIADAAAVLDQANVAAKANADEIKLTQAEIAELEKLVPKITRIMLVKEMSRQTQLRRAGL